MLLKQLLENLPVTSVEGPLEREVTGIAYDSRRVIPGMLFVAMPGLRDGESNSIPSAVDRGAVAVVVEEKGFVSKRATKINVRSARSALARAAAAYYQHPSSQLRMIAVAGGEARASTAFLLRHLAMAGGTKTGLMGRCRCEIGGRVLPVPRVFPEALEVQQMLAQMVETGYGACVVEVDSLALEQGRLLGVEFDHAVWVDSEDESRRDERVSPTRGLPAVGARTLVHLESGPKARGEVIEALLHPAEAIEGGRSCGVWVRAEGVPDRRVSVQADQLEAWGSRLQLQLPSGDFPLVLPLVGMPHVRNAAVAAAVGMALGFDAESMLAALAKAPQIPGQLEAVRRGQPFGVFVDQASTPRQLRETLRALRQTGSSRLIAVLGSPAGRSGGERACLGQAAAALANFAYFTMDNPKQEDPDQIAIEIEDGFLSLRENGYRIVADRRQAIDAAIRMAEPGDMVLVAGKGSETCQEVANTIVPFDDRLYAADTLGALGWRDTVED